MKPLKQLLISCLLRCYPRAWRDRYGEEFAALLEQAPLDMAQLLDALRSAIDARWRWGRAWMDKFGGVRLDEDERRFWRRWVLTLGIVGAFVAAIFRTVPMALVGFGLGDPNSGWIFWQQALYSLPLFGLVAIGCGIAEWRTLRQLFPAVSRWWIAATVVGPIGAMMVLSTRRDHRLLPDLWSMTVDFQNYLGNASTPWIGAPGYSNVIGFALPTLYFGGVAAAMQAYVIKGVVPRASAWIVIATLAALAGLVTARLIAPVRSSPDRWFSTGPTQNALHTLDIVLTIPQLAAACAVYGIATGLGLIALRRADRAAQTSASVTI